ncbi:FKBP-type peptidylprolyl cis-trans isomerase [Heterostelium album PN500]|uniref:peptidylprolyl isomerase n=1 Tax=Heterostelium pallidum (strain ATCC 26659 / Pp 5 / PN500) TaxID=670386 RepID=D3B699_HETP5|nr:FKBP-type peptidylprolyl cis-trans isomerase [Heterostelium album PN500]EFA82869.1 FKBP-type peptidylprolyl cis-trans isomerase [Heterostelium album PN500]|eukprot:XP_020434986.1 FKBP-type peptidylprolyl cis-trans isomerase [Heterostelium album PN500]
MGVDKVVIKAGNGIKPPKGVTVTVHYIGKLKDGTIFDNSIKKGVPYTFKLGFGKVIKGWDQGVAEMSVGEKAELTITPDLGYGARGIPGVIPGNSVLIFEVELITFK